MGGGNIARKVKCPTCGALNEKENTTELSGRYYCVECAKKKIEERENKKTDWDLLFNYICEIYNIDKPTGMMFRQLKEYRGEPYNYTDGGMYATLKYIYEIEEKEIKDGAGLGLIPYYYEKTKNHYLDMQRIEDSLENYKPENQKVINISSLNQKKEIKQLEFSNEDWEE